MKVWCKISSAWRKWRGRTDVSLCGADLDSSITFSLPAGYSKIVGKMVIPGMLVAECSADSRAVGDVWPIVIEDHSGIKLGSGLIMVLVGHDQRIDEMKQIIRSSIHLRDTGRNQSPDSQ